MQSLPWTTGHALGHRPWVLAVVLGLAALSMGSGRPQEPAAAAPAADNGPWLEFPDDPLGRLWASVGDETSPRVGSRAPAGLDAWARWADALGQLDGASEARRAALVDLARIALDDDRTQDAFAWIIELGADDPAGLAGNIPALFPGVGADVDLGPGGRPLPMPDGVVLRPMLSPRSAAARAGSIEVRRATARGLKIGDAVFDMLLKVDGSGVVCDITHRSGGTATFDLHLPAPTGFRLKSTYVNWEKQQLPDGADPDAFDWRTVPLRIEVVPSEDPFTVFARLARSTTPFPTPSARGQALPRATARDGLILVVSQGADAAAWGAVADAWSQALGLPAHVRVVANDLEAALAGGASGPIAIRLDRAGDPAALRRLVTSAIEARLRDSR